jgi:thiopeptide-type bacteriocin biosynthesis protein
VLFARLHGHPDGFDTILTGHLPSLLTMWDEPPMWWFIRYRDPDPHLRLRLHLAGGHGYGQAAERVGQWATTLRRQGLIGELVLDTYRPETVRSGPGKAMAAAEALFAADSAAVLAQLTALAASPRLHPAALTAASMVDLASAMLGSLPAGMRWLIDHARAGGDPLRDRDVLRQTVTLTDPTEAETTSQACAGGVQIATAWHARRHAAVTYAALLGSQTPHVRPDSVVASLLHMHHIRALGISPGPERLCHRLARAAALAWTARHTTGEGHS